MLKWRKLVTKKANGLKRFYYFLILTIVASNYMQGIKLARINGLNRQLSYIKFTPDISAQIFSLYVNWAMKTFLIVEMPSDIKCKVS